MRAARVAVVVAAGLAAVAATALGPRAAPAAVDCEPGQVLRYPSELSEDDLRLALQSCDEPTTVIFEKGTHTFATQLFVFQRSNLVLRGAGRRAKDVVIESPGGGTGSAATAAVLMEQVENVTLEGLTIRATADTSGQGLRLNAQLGTDFASFVDGVTLRRCTIEAEFPVVATAGARNLTVDRCRIECGRSDSFGIAWGDGAGLLVARSRFTTAPGVQALSAVFVQGATAALSEGERAPRILLTRNRVTGDYLRGFDLADVRDARIRRNRFRFPGESQRVFQGTSTGRVGVLVRRGQASSLPEGFEVTRNKVRNAFYGAWILNGGEGAVRRNDFRRCGSQTPDEFFNEYGGGVRLTLFSANCRIDVAGNDLRRLRSPTRGNVNPSDPGSAIVDVPAVVVVPGELSGACFEDDDGGNRLSGGRVLFRRDDG